MSCSRHGCPTTGQNAPISCARAVLFESALEVRARVLARAALSSAGVPGRCVADLLGKLKQACRDVKHHKRGRARRIGGALSGRSGIQRRPELVLRRRVDLAPTSWRRVRINPSSASVGKFVVLEADEEIHAAPNPVFAAARDSSRYALGQALLGDQLLGPFQHWAKGS